MTVIKAVLFDLDGTLSNTLDDLAAAGNHTLQMLNMPTHEVDKYRYFVGNGIPNLIGRILPEDKRDDSTRAKALGIFLDYYGEHYKDRTAPYDGIIPMLDGLTERGIKLAVITNKAESAARQIVSEMFGDRFAVVLGQTDDRPLKPDPAAPNLAMKQLGVSPDECLFAGDSGVDMCTGTACGAHPVGVLWGFRGREELLSNGAEYIIDRPDQLINIVSDLED